MANLNEVRTALKKLPKKPQDKNIIDWREADEKDPNYFTPVKIPKVDHSGNSLSEEDKIYWLVQTLNQFFNIYQKLRHFKGAKYSDAANRMSGALNIRTKSLMELLDQLDLIEAVYMSSIDEIPEPMHWSFVREAGRYIHNTFQRNDVKQLVKQLRAKTRGLNQPNVLRRYDAVYSRELSTMTNELLLSVPSENLAPHASYIGGEILNSHVRAILAPSKTRIADELARLGRRNVVDIPHQHNDSAEHNTQIEMLKKTIKDNERIIGTLTKENTQLKSLVGFLKQMIQSFIKWLGINKVSTTKTREHIQSQHSVISEPDALKEKELNAVIESLADNKADETLPPQPMPNSVDSSAQTQNPGSIATLKEEKILTPKTQFTSIAELIEKNNWNEIGGAAFLVPTPSFISELESYPREKIELFYSEVILGLFNHSNEFAFSKLTNGDHFILKILVRNMTLLRMVINLHDQLNKEEKDEMDGYNQKTVMTTTNRQTVSNILAALTASSVENRPYYEDIDFEKGSDLRNRIENMRIAGISASPLKAIKTPNKASEGLVPVTPLTVGKLANHLAQYNEEDPVKGGVPSHSLPSGESDSSESIQQLLPAVQKQKQDKTKEKKIPKSNFSQTSGSSVMVLQAVQPAAGATGRAPLARRNLNLFNSPSNSSSASAQQVLPPPVAAASNNPGGVTGLDFNKGSPEWIEPAASLVGPHVGGVLQPKSSAPSQNINAPTTPKPLGLS